MGRRRYYNLSATTNPTMKVLATKAPDKDAIAYATSLGFDLQGFNFIASTAAAFDITEVETSPYDSIAFTSANAVNYFFEKVSAATIKGKTVYAIQGKTSDALKQLGISAKQTAENAGALSKKIIATGKTKSLLHVCGNKVLDDLEEGVKAASIHYRKLVVYTTQLIPHEVKHDYDALLFYSPSGVESFLLKNKIPVDAVCCCIGVTTAMALTK